MQEPGSQRRQIPLQPEVRAVVSCPTRKPSSHPPQQQCALLTTVRSSSGTVLLGNKQARRFSVLFPAHKSLYEIFWCFPQPHSLCVTFPGRSQYCEVLDPQVGSSVD